MCGVMLQAEVILIDNAKARASALEAYHAYVEDLASARTDKL
jgi:hypothetical protein